MMQIMLPIHDALAALEKANWLYTTADKVDDLPQAFHEVAKAIAPACDSLKAVKTHIDTRRPESDVSSDVAEAEKRDAAEKFCTKAARLYDIFAQVIPPGDGPRPARYRSVARKGERVEALMEEILQGILVVATEAVTSPALFAALQKALEDVSKILPSLHEDNGNMINNYGDGPQNVHLGHGDMNINSGSAPQFIGQFMAPFNLPK